MSSKKVVLKSCDGKSFEVDEAVARQSETIARMLEDGSCMENGVPLSDVRSETLAKVIQYCKKHVEATATKSKAVNKELKAWDAEFMKIDLSMLSDLMQAAEVLEIQKLLDLTYETLADMMKGKTPEEIGKIFNSKKDKIPKKDLRAFVLFHLVFYLFVFFVSLFFLFFKSIGI